MNIRPATTAKRIRMLAAVAALVATPAAFASAADAPFDTAAPSGAAAFVATPGTHYRLVDASGNVVGELVTETRMRLQLRPKSALPTTPDRAFHPDYAQSLTPGEMSAAWQAEWDRINPPLVTGGG
jgi:hypothetical protein